MDTVSFGLFTFVHLNSAPDALPIKAFADFRYSDGAWHLNQFDYGCDHRGLDATMRDTMDCRSVYVYKPPPK